MRSAGYRSRAFASAGELLAMASSTRVDCIVTDINMPGMTGIDLLKIVKKRHANVAVIVMTAEVDERKRAEAKACGAEAYIEKPFDAINLLVWIAASLGEATPRH